MNKKKILFLNRSAMIAAVYIVLTFAAAAFGLASGAIQVRLSEMLTILPYYTLSAVPGITIGCLLSNILTGSGLLDIIFGTLATLLGALGSYALRRHKWLVPLPPILANTIIVPLVLKASGFQEGLPFLMATVGIGEVISCGLLGMLLLFVLKKYKRVLFADN